MGDGDAPGIKAVGGLAAPASPEAAAEAGLGHAPLPGGKDLGLSLCVKASAPAPPAREAAAAPAAPDGAGRAAGAKSACRPVARLQAQAAAPSGGGGAGTPPAKVRPAGKKGAGAKAKGPALGALGHGQRRINDFFLAKPASS